MNFSPEINRLAVCSWSLLPSDPNDLVEKLSSTGVHRVQLALDPLRESPAIWGSAASILEQAEIMVVSGMFGCVGEDYSTLESIRKSGGICPDTTWDQNLANIHATVPIAVALGLKLVTFHAGFVPHDPADPDYAKMLGRLAAVSKIFGDQGIVVGLETGQERAEELAQLLNALNDPNVCINFDPANMLLYGKGDPILALRLLSPWIGQVHIKDAVTSRVPEAWGEEVPVGTGEVNWHDFFSVLAQANYKGDLVIEREAGNQRLTDIRLARELVVKYIF
jgi:L-ribulose-5-phosphate 3-epimerase